MTDEHTPTKRCTKCGTEYPATTEWFYANPRGKLDLGSRCKNCCREYMSQRLQDPEYRERQREYMRQRRQDPTVRERAREYDRQYRQDPTVREQRRKYQQQYYQDPMVRERQCERRRDPAYLERQRERQREYMRRRQQDPEYREQKREWDRQRLQDPVVREQKRERDRQRRQDPTVRERLRQRQQDPEYRERESERLRQRQQDPEYRERQKIYWHNRLARKRALPNTLTSADTKGMLDYWEGCCAVCGKRADFWTTIAYDHWIALSDPREDNPGTVPINILPLCHARPGVPSGETCCNNSKLNRDPEEWLVERFGKRKAAQILKRINAYFEWVRQQDNEDKTA